MNYLAGITLAAAVLFNANALAGDALTAGAGRQVVALSGVQYDNASAIDAGTLERYSGRYATDDGLRFIVSLEAGRLTIDLPESWGLGQPDMTAETSEEFKLEGVPMHVRFETTTTGVVTGLVIYDASGERSVTAIKLPPRHGVVSIYDVDTDAAIAAN
jgi:hypothetical protein